MISSGGGNGYDILHVDTSIDILFEMLEVSQSPLGAGDTIRGFITGEDVINISSIDDDGLAVNGHIVSNSGALIPSSGSGESCV